MLLSGASYKTARKEPSSRSVKATGGGGGPQDRSPLLLPPADNQAYHPQWRRHLLSRAIQTGTIQCLSTTLFLCQKSGPRLYQISVSVQDLNTRSWHCSPICIMYFIFIYLLPTAIGPCPVAVLHKQWTIRKQYYISNTEWTTERAEWQKH
jgi:hypothetical protein